MKTLVMLSLALGSLAVACAPPTTINITPAGGNNGGDGGSGNTGEGGTGNTGQGGTGNTGEGGSAGTMVQPETAHSYYVDTLHPMLISVCGACHNPDNLAGAPAFLDFDAELSYQITKDYNGGIFIEPAVTSLLTNKGLHDGPAMTPEQYDATATWLAMEIEEGNVMMPGTSSSSGGTGSPPTLEEMLTSFSACMDFTLWDATGMDLFPLQQTNGDGACNSCHLQGVGAAWLSADALETFNMNKQFPYIMRLVTPIYEGSNPVDLAPSNRFINKGLEPCADPNGVICHPQYNLSTTNVQALEDFVGSTLQQWHNGTCGQTP